MRIFLNRFVMLFMGFFLGVSVTAVIAQEDSREKAIEAAKNKPTKLEMYYDYVEKFKNASGSSTNEHGRVIDFSKDCLNDKYCHLYGFAPSDMSGSASSKLGKCIEYFEYKYINDYSFDENDPKSFDRMIQKYEDQLDAQECELFFSGFRVANQMDYLIRAQNNLPPPLLCLDQHGMEERFYRAYIDFFKRHSVKGLGVGAAAYMVMAEKDQFCNPQSVGLE